MAGRAKRMRSLRQSRAAIASKREDCIRDARMLRGKAKRRAKMARDRTDALIRKIDAQMDHIMEEDRLESRSSAMHRMTKEQTDQFRRTVAQMQVAAQGSVSSTQGSDASGGTDQGVLTVQPGDLVARPMSFEEQVVRLAKAYPIAGTNGMVRVGSQEMSPELAEVHRIDMGFSRLCELRFGREAFPIEVSVKVPWERPVNTSVGVVIPLLLWCAHFMLSAKVYVQSGFFPGPVSALFVSALVSTIIAVGPTAAHNLIRRRKQWVSILIRDQQAVRPFLATVVSGGCTNIIGYAELKNRSPGMGSGSLLDAIQRVLDERSAEERKAERERQEALDRENDDKRSAHDDVEGQLELESERARYRATGVEGLEQLEAELEAEARALEQSLQGVRDRAEQKKTEEDPKKRAAATSASRERA